MTSKGTYRHGARARLNTKRGVVAAVTAMLLTGCSGTSNRWAETPPPVVTVTDEVLTENNHLRNGVYWAEIAPVSGSERIVFRVGRARFGEACLQWAASMGFEDACMNDYEVENYPEAYVELTDNAVVTVAIPDGPEGNLLIDPATLHRLVFGAVTEMPGDYEWVPFPFVLTVENGYVTVAEQLWVP